MYTIEDLVAASKRLGYSPTMVEAAMRLHVFKLKKKKTKFTLEEAKAIIKKFAESEV